MLTAVNIMVCFVRFFKFVKVQEEGFMFKMTILYLR